MKLEGVDFLVRQSPQSGGLPAHRSVAKEEISLLAHAHIGGIDIWNVAHAAKHSLRSPPPCPRLSCLRGPPTSFSGARWFVNSKFNGRVTPVKEDALEPDL